MTTGRYYAFHEIESFASKNSYELEELGKEIIGQNFIVLYGMRTKLTF